MSDVQLSACHNEFDHGTKKTLRGTPPKSCLSNLPVSLRVLQNEMVDCGHPALEYTMVWRTLQYVMLWLKSMGRAGVVLLMSY